MLYLIQRDDCGQFRICGDLDPVYARLFQRAIGSAASKPGGEMRVSPHEIAVAGRVIAMDETASCCFMNRIRRRQESRRQVTYIEAASAPSKIPGVIRLYTPEDFAGMRKGLPADRALPRRAAPASCKPGVTTEAIDRFVFDFGMDHGALPATLNYRGYTKSICTSINHVVCHGIPTTKPLREGDIVNIDVTFILDGWHGDSSRMYPVGAGQARRRAAARGHL